MSIEEGGGFPPKEFDTFSAITYMEQAYYNLEHILSVTKYNKKILKDINNLDEEKFSEVLAILTPIYDKWSREKRKWGN